MVDIPGGGALVGRRVRAGARARGVGVREAAFVAAVSGMDSGVAAATAVLARALFVLVDAVGALTASGWLARHRLSGRSDPTTRPPRPTGPARPARPASPTKRLNRPAAPPSRPLRARGRAAGTALPVHGRRYITFAAARSSIRPIVRLPAIPNRDVVAHRRGGRRVRSQRARGSDHPGSSRDRGHRSRRCRRGRRRRGAATCRSPGSSTTWARPSTRWRSRRSWRRCRWPSTASLGGGPTSTSPIRSTAVGPACCCGRSTTPRPGWPATAMPGGGRSPRWWRGSTRSRRHRRLAAGAERPVTSAWFARGPCGRPRCWPGVPHRRYAGPAPRGSRPTRSSRGCTTWARRRWRRR